MWTKRTREPELCEPELCEPELCEPKSDNFNEKKFKIVHKILVHISLVHAYFLTLFSNHLHHHLWLKCKFEIPTKSQ